MKSDFEKLSELWTAIRDVDEIYHSNNEDKIDDVVNAVKNINKREFDAESQNIIVSGFRQGLLNIYQILFDDLNNGIDKLGGLATSQFNRTKPADSENTSVNRIENVNNGSTQEYFVSSQNIPEYIDEDNNNEEEDVEEPVDVPSKTIVDDSKIPAFLKSKGYSKK